MNSKKYNVVIIGSGNIGACYDNPESSDILSHAHIFSTDKRFHLLGFYDLDNRKSKYAAHIWNKRAYSSMMEALEEADIACCCVPDKFHGKVIEELSKYVLKLIVLEKPVATSLLEAEEIRKCVQKKGIPVLVNYSRRFIKEFQILKQKILCMGTYLKGTGYYGKGAIHNGTHMIDLILYLIGKDVEILRVKNPINDYSGDDISYDIELRVSEGFFNMIAVDCRVVTIFELDLFFEKARIRILDGGTLIEIYTLNESSTLKNSFHYSLSETIKINYSGALCGLADNIIDYLDNGKKMLCSLDDGIKVIEILSGSSLIDNM